MVVHLLRLSMRVVSQFSPLVPNYFSYFLSSHPFFSSFCPPPNGGGQDGKGFPILIKLELRDKNLKKNLLNPQQGPWEKQRKSGV